MRVPPRLSCKEVIETLRQKLTAPGPETFDAEIQFECTDFGDGFDSPDLPANIKAALNDATAEVFSGAQPLYVGIGGSIPFMEVMSQ